MNSIVHDSEPCIVGIGAQSSIGATAASSAASVRARIANFTESKYVDRCGHAVVVARAPWLDETLPFIERVCALARGAIDQAVENCPQLKQVKSARISLLICFPEYRPGFSREIVAQCRDYLSQTLVKHCSVSRVEVFPLGHASGFVALSAAAKELASKSADLCIVGGVDSYLHSETLRWIEDEGQLHSENLSWGFIPGEASGFCLLVSQEIASQLKCTTYARLSRVAVSNEVNRIKTRTVCIGKGLSAAFAEALSALQDEERISYMVGDLNGEPYRADEFGFSVVRNAESFVDPGSVQTPTSYWGDIGAASAFLFLALAVKAQQRGYAPGPNALLWASSEGGTRGAGFFRCGARGERI